MCGNSNLIATSNIVYITQDKVTLKMFASLIQLGKVERALDLVSRLNLEKSFDLAMTIADKNRKLVQMIDIVREQKFPDSDDEDEEMENNTMDSITHDMDRKRISPDSNTRGRVQLINDGRNVRPRNC